MGKCSLLDPDAESLFWEVGGVSSGTGSFLSGWSVWKAGIPRERHKSWLSILAVTPQGEREKRTKADFVTNWRKKSIYCPLNFSAVLCVWGVRTVSHWPLEGRGWSPGSPELQCCDPWNVSIMSVLLCGAGPGFLRWMNADCVPMKGRGKKTTLSQVFESNSPCLCLLGTRLVDWLKI